MLEKIKTVVTEKSEYENQKLKWRTKQRFLEFSDDEH